MRFNLDLAETDWDLVIECHCGAKYRVRGFLEPYLQCGHCKRVFPVPNSINTEEIHPDTMNGAVLVLEPDVFGIVVKLPEVRDDQDGSEKEDREAEKIALEIEAERQAEKEIVEDPYNE